MAERPKPIRSDSSINGKLSTGCWVSLSTRNHFFPFTGLAFTNCNSEEVRDFFPSIGCGYIIHIDAVDPSALEF